MTNSFQEHFTLQAQAFPTAEIVGSENEVRERVFDAFRRWGYLESDLDPLGYFPRELHPELHVAGDIADQARRIYCGTIGAEFMHIYDAERRRWIQDQLEREAPAFNREAFLDRLVEADLFEQVVQNLYIGTKRFSLEGNTSLIPLLDIILVAGVELGAEEFVMAMSHRGRLNVVRHIVGRPAEEIFANFEDVDPRSVLGGGDVKYHQGATGSREINGKDIRIHLVSNPSHLEAVDPVCEGRVRAKQTRRGKDGKRQTLPVIMHGDSAFAGQGVWAETLNMSQLRGYTVGGTVNIIVNNLIGFTTNPSESQSSRFASDVAKRLQIPILHVNAEDPEAVARVARIATAYRYTFGSDVVIDLIGYRRHGHSEVDDPTITQPLMYKRIKAHAPLYEIYAKKLGVDPKPKMEQVRTELQGAQKQAQQMTRKPMLYTLPSYWDNYEGGLYEPSYEVNTGVVREELADLAEKLTQYPADFHIHPKVKKLLEQRAEMAQGKRPVDYGMAEALALASLAVQGTPIRISGQDSRRGTFNHRHSALIDTENEREYVPLCHLDAKQARVEIYNSELSEAAVMGFEYGFSRDYPEALVVWEAQFGDFANGGQIIIDQFITAGEEKWGLLSGLVLLLPHGYEGQGPEHSSARIERYLQLCARDNMQVCQPSSAAQYFHLLRRQVMRRWRKPLVVFTPKSMLRHPEAASSIDALGTPQFQNVMLDTEVEKPTRVLMCTGKLGHELRMERKRRKDTETAIVFLDQMYPFPEREIKSMLKQYGDAREIIWVQEEPANMGALFFVLPRLRRLAAGRPVRSIKRAAAASPATGSAKAHEMEQHTLISLAFGS
ncbi:MAG TPA: 2-oxoglutarate dehydrogenase E1 component [Clostridia bacterium]|nr:2-oxoglutarate dehydrogenase E1 component [Clostridia bacterium]